MATIIFSQDELKKGFKLSPAFLNSPACDLAVTYVTANLSFKHDGILVVTQTDVTKRPDFKVGVLNNFLKERLQLNSVVENLRNGRGYSIPQIDGLWFDRDQFDVAVLSFSQVAPIITAEAGSWAFIGTMLRQEITEKNFINILSAIPTNAKLKFKVLLSTCYQYSDGTLPLKIKSILSDLKVKCDITKCIAATHNSYMSGFADSDPTIGPLNNLACIF